MNITEFTEHLFGNSPLPPFSYFMQLDGNYEHVLGNMLIKGAKIIYGKQLCELSDVEIGNLRQYLLSMGWDADYNMVELFKSVLDYHPDGTPYIAKIVINNWQVTFKAADPALRPVGLCGNEHEMVRL